MRMIIRQSDGSLLGAFLLGTIGKRLRVALPGCDDAMEYRWTGGQWRDESGAAVEIEFGPDEDVFARRVRYLQAPLAVPAYAFAAASARSVSSYIN